MKTFPSHNDASARPGWPSTPLFSAVWAFVIRHSSFVILSCSLIFATTAHGQWRTETYTLKGGWNAIYLTGDAPQNTIENLFPSQVVEVWRWNTNPTQIQFMDSPLAPSAGTPEWGVWRRSGPSTFSQLTGQTSYLVKCTGTSANTYTVALTQKPLPPKAAWVRNGANLLGMPTFKNGSNFPSFNNYFATFPTVLGGDAKIFKYVGGDLGTGNPLQVFSTKNEQVDRTKAYWFSSEVTGNFYGPLEITVNTAGGLDFGRAGSVVTAYVRNRSAAPITITLAAVASESAPSGQTSISGPVPLTRRIFNPSTVTWTETPLAGSSPQTIPAQSTVELKFGINRTAMTGAANSAFASFLRVTDNGNLMDVYLPATALKASLAGLWIGDAQVSTVISKVPGSPGTSTPSAFPLRTLLHVATDDTAKLLSQVFIGQLATAPNDIGICTLESRLKQDAKATAQRFVAAHLPLDQVISGAGSVAAGATLTCTVSVPFDDPTNPFVHQYHPDHDNKNARGAPLLAGDESYNVNRVCTFTFTAAPPAGSAVTTGWGSSVIGGTYSETITGIHKHPIVVGGTFELRRASEIATLTQ